jgi:hypothetical protein
LIQALIIYSTIYYYLNTEWYLIGTVYIRNKRIKVKQSQLQAFTGPEVSRSLRLPDFKKIGTKSGKFVSPTHRPPLPPGNIPGTHFC